MQHNCWGHPRQLSLPEDSPTIKLERTKAFGAKVIMYDRENEDRDAIALKICEETGASFIHPFNHPLVCCRTRYDWSGNY